MTDEQISEPHDPGDFPGDIFYGHPNKTTLGTHRWENGEWVRLPSETESLIAFLAQAHAENDRLRADAQAAVALVVERAAEAVGAVRDELHKRANLSYPIEAAVYRDAADGTKAAIEKIATLATEDGLAMVDALRKERDEWKAVSETLSEMQAGEYRRAETLAADLAAAQAHIETLRGVNTHGADTIATVLILDIAAALQGRDRVVLTTDETSLGPRILEFAAAALPVPNFSAGWPLEEGDGSIIVGATKPAKEGE